MRDYQPRQKNKYRLPIPVYHQTVWLIRDYDRICSELNDILLASPDPPDGQPHGTNLSDEAFAKAKRRDQLVDKKNAIDNALARVPDDYRKGVWDNVQLRKSFPKDADRTTYARHKSAFILDVAISMNFIEKK